MGMTKTSDVLPQSLAPRGLSRVQAAAYIGVSPSLFDEMVQDGRMPKATSINARKVWDRIKLDEAFAALSDEERQADDPWSNLRV
jgi:predicted DNA-binding transcriptional regulator AlpA